MDDNEAMEEMGPDPQWVEMTVWSLKKYKTSDIITDVPLPINLYKSTPQKMLYSTLYVQYKLIYKNVTNNMFQNWVTNLHMYTLHGWTDRQTDRQEHVYRTWSIAHIHITYICGHTHAEIVDTTISLGHSDI